MADVGDGRAGASSALEADPGFVRRLLDTDPSLIFVKDRHGRFVYVNQAVATLFGSAASDLIGRLNAHVHPHRREVRGYADVDHVVLTTGRRVTVEETFTRPNGDVVHVETTKVALERNGERYVLGVGVDVTARKRAEADAATAELRQAEARFRALVAGVPDLLFRMTVEGTFLDYVPSEAVPLAVPPEEFLGRNVHDVFPALADRLVDALARADAAGAVQTVAYQLAEIGLHRYFEARVSPLGNGEAMVLVRDVMPMQPCTAPRSAAGHASRCSTRRCGRGPWRAWPTSATSDAPSPKASWVCATSRRWTCPRAASWGSRRSCAGTTPSVASSPRRRSSTWPRRSD